MTDVTALRLVLARAFARGARRPMRLRARSPGFSVSGVPLLGAALLILAFWQLNVTHLVRDASPVVSLERLELSLAPGDSAVIGRRELLQPERSDAAESQHVAFARDRDGRVSLRNVAAVRRLWLDYAGGSGSFSARWRLAAGDRIAAGGLSLTVVRADADRLELALKEAGAPAERTLVVERGGAGSSVTLDGAAPPICQARGVADRLRQIVTGLIAADDRGEETVLALGGRLTCGVREETFIAATAIPFRALTVTARGGSFYLAPGDAPDAPRPPVVFARDQQRIADFSGIAWELDPAGDERLTALIIGRTRYDVTIGQEAGGRLPIALTPVSKAYRLAPDEAAALAEAATTDVATPRLTEPRQPMSRAELGNSLSTLNGGERVIRLALCVGLAGFAIAAAFRNALLLRRRATIAGLAGALIASGLAGAVALLALTPELGAAFGAAVSFEDGLRATTAAYALATLPIMLTGRFTTAFRVVWLGLLLLCCLGSLTLLSLAIDAEKTDFAIHAEKNKLLFFDIVPVLAIVVALQPSRFVEALPRSFFMGTRLRDQLLRAVPAAAILFSFVLWAMVGTETGVAGFQPVELGKITLVLVLAHIFLGFSRIEFFYDRRRYASWLTVSLATVLVFLLFLTAIPFLKSDYSPALIIIVTAVVLAFAFLLPSTLRKAFGLIGVFLRRADAPQAPVRRLGWPRGGVLAVTLFALLALNAVVILALPGLITYAIAGRWTLPQERTAAIDLLEQARGGALRVPAERLLTWYDLDHTTARERATAAGAQPDVVHRDLGFQLLQSKVALAEAPCVLTRLDLGVDRLPDEVRRIAGPALPRADALCAFAPGAPRTAAPERRDPDDAVRRFTVQDLVRIPVVQNDFIATFLLVRFGLPAGGLLLLAEFLTVAGLLVLALDLLRARARGTAQEGARRGMAIILVGVATLFTLHWAISWGNAIGLLPVMGQPMTFIAAATSHHLLMALPCIALALLAGRLAALDQRVVTSDPPAWGVLRGLARPLDAPAG